MLNLVLTHYTFKIRGVIRVEFLLHLVYTYSFRFKTNQQILYFVFVRSLYSLSAKQLLWILPSFYFKYIVGSTFTIPFLFQVEIDLILILLLYCNMQYEYKPSLPSCKVFHPHVLWRYDISQMEKNVPVFLFLNQQSIWLTCYISELGIS